MDSMYRGGPTGPQAFGRVASGLALALLAVTACDKPPAATQPAVTPATSSAPAPPSEPIVQPPKSPILTESATWSKEIAIQKLTNAESDDAARISAAVRLIRLEETQPALLPDPLPDREAARLRILTLGEFGWVLGREGFETNRVAAPVLIRTTGEIVSPLDGAEEEVSQLIRSEDADRFPHVLLTPTRVLLIGEDVRPAIVARDLNGARLDHRVHDGNPVIAIELRRPSPEEAATQAASQPAIIATYYWDPLELAFVGPGSDRLPDPPGGFFELDLEQSTALVPVGGELKPVETPPAPKRPESTEPPEF